MNTTLCAVSRQSHARCTQERRSATYRHRHQDQPDRTAGRRSSVGNQSGRHARATIPTNSASATPLCGAQRRILKRLKLKPRWGPTPMPPNWPNVTRKSPIWKIKTRTWTNKPPICAITSPAFKRKCRHGRQAGQVPGRPGSSLEGVETVAGGKDGFGKSFQRLGCLASPGAQA